MPMMRSLTPTRIASVSGYIVVVKPEGSYVPDAIVDEAMYRGCVVMEAEATTEPVEPPAVEPPPDRQTRLIEVVRQLLLKGDPDDFTITGAPRTRSVNRELDGEFTATTGEVAKALAATQTR